MPPISLTQLLSLEHAGWQALCGSAGGTFYGELMTPDAIFVLVNGAVMSRDEVVRSLNDAPAWDAYEITSPRRLDLGDDAAGLVYRAEATRGDLPEPFVALMTSVYRRVEGRLRLAVYQQTAAG